MEFRTELKDFSFPFNIEYSNSLFFVGSCFSENMSRRFSDSKFSVFSNPFGTLYNPISISNCLIDIAKQVSYGSSIVSKNEGIFYSWKHHGSVAGLSSNELLENVNSINSTSFSKLKNSKYLFITLGSAWAYRLKSTGEIVANCHKVPASEFEKVLISSEEIITSFTKSISLLNELNPDLNIIFTISPVRHKRDGLIENNRSKAELIRASHSICALFDFCHYLPVYEWVIDDLRDYRFYEKDLVHPNKLAQDYIWEKLEALFFSTETQSAIKRINNFLTGLRHRPFNPSSENHISFLNKLLSNGIQIQKELDIDLKNEIKDLENTISINL